MTGRFARAHALGLAVAIALVGSGCGETPAQTPRLELSSAWIEASPADAGMDAQGLEATSAEAATLPRFRSLLVARHGRLAFERYFAGADANTLFDVRSVTKSVVSALAGIAVADQALPGLDVSIAGYLSPPYLLDEAERGITLRHLLTMTSGFQWHEVSGNDYNLWIVSDDHVQFLFDRPQALAPGAEFTYNSAAVHVLGVILQRATATTLPQYAKDRLFRPLGIDTVGWEPLDRGTVNGGSGIQLRGRDLLKFGQLFLQRGWSGERSVVPESWVDEVTRAQFAWRNTVGAQRRVTYGMLWWVSDDDPPAFFAWGYGGQFVYVAPSLALVVVATTDWRQLAEITPRALEEGVLDVIVRGVLAAAS